MMEEGSDEELMMWIKYGGCVLGSDMRNWNSYFIGEVMAKISYNEQQKNHTLDAWGEDDEEEESNNND